jgi:myosin heavy subunit
MEETQTEVPSLEENENEMETWQETCRRMLSKERVGLDDMTELEHVDDHTIGENLRIRLLEEQIYVSVSLGK